MKARRSVKEAFRSPDVKLDTHRAQQRLGTVQKQRELRDARDRMLRFLSAASYPSYPCSCTLERFSSEEDDQIEFDRNEFEIYVQRSCHNSSAILEMEMEDLNKVTSWLDRADQMQVFFKVDLIQRLPNIDLLTGGLVTRLNVRNARSNITLPYVIVALVYCLQHHHSAVNVLTESNISQLLKLCLSRAVYPLNGETQTTEAYRELCHCR